VIVDGSTYHHTSVKYEFDGKGLPNQCITPNILRSVQPTYRLPTSDPKATVIYNIALKINSKLGGINCLPMTNDPLNLWKEYINDNDLTMFIGIDTRLSNQKKKLGIVGITVSIDNTASRYNAFAIMTDGIHRYCSDYTNILYQAFDLYEGSSGQPGQFPNKIMIFRAGMNEHDAIYREGNTEINHIRNIIDQYMIDKNYRRKPKITYIAYHRTHNVRFYDISKENSTRGLRSDKDIDNEGYKWNCSPGTVIDGQITDPNCFYLISHETFLGTTKPAKYTIVIDETRFKADNLLAIVYQLCRLMSQTSRPFRRPTPIGLTSKLLTRCLDVVPKLFNEYGRNQEFFIHTEFRDKPFYV
jgi:eukaryotic translation initiation factor 2C